MRGEGYGPGGLEAVGQRQRKQHALYINMPYMVVQGTGGAHLKHDVHGCDAGRVETQRLIER